MKKKIYALKILPTKFYTKSNSIELVDVKVGEGLEV